jgi:hypothetical protein
MIREDVHSNDFDYDEAIHIKDKPHYERAKARQTVQSLSNIEISEDELDYGLDEEFVESLFV